DEKLHADSFQYEAYKARERTKHELLAFAQTNDGFVYASGKTNTELLLRENIPITYQMSSGEAIGETKVPIPQGTVLSGKITAENAIGIIRLDALAEETIGNNISYEYSTDNKTWIKLGLNENTAIDTTSKELYLKAEVPEDSRLLAWHLEGVSGTCTKTKVELVTAPINVAAVDYGKYYEDDAQKNYTLKWEDPNKKSKDVKCAVAYDIYKDGTLIAEIPEEKGKSCVDLNYLENASYAVSVKYIYGEISGSTLTLYPHESLTTKAEKVVIPPEEKLDAVKFTAEEYEQSKYLDDLYGGGYTFSTEPSPPKGERLLNLKMLGKNKYCAIGFEPINFNTGNFFMEQADFVLADIGQANLNVVRTYNTQSEMTDGPFGAGWDSEFAQHLVLYPNGDFGYVRADGSTVFFTRNADGSFSGNDDDNMIFEVSEDQMGYCVRIPQSKRVYGFTPYGFLKYIITDETNKTTIERDEKGLMTGVVAPSGVRLDVQMDEKGHILELKIPGGGTLQYEYDG
ncbi:MAG: DUF6531 domain-containing protein, partial [Christensenella sp.]